MQTTTTYYQQGPPPPPPPFYEAPPPPLDGTFQPQEATSLQAGSQSRFVPDNEYRDPAFVVLFALTLGAFGAIFIVALVMSPPATYQGFLPQLSNWQQILVLIEIIAILVGVAISFSVLWILLMNAFPTFMVHFGIVVNLVLMLATTAYAIAVGAFIWAIFSGIFLLWWIFFYITAWNRIPFACEILRVTTSITKSYPATQITAYLSLLVMIAFQSFWVYTVFLAQQRFSYSTNIGLFVFFVFTFYWTMQVIKNVVHVTVSGLFATWYFMSNAMPPNPTLGAFARAMTTSFGSICLGSLIVALIQTLRAIIGAFRGNRNNLLAACADCILGCIDALVQYFNHYAFVQCAIYGRTFCQAAKATWNLIKTAGIEAIVNDNLLGGILFAGILLNAIVTGGAAALFSLVVFPVLSSFLAVTIILGVLIGYIIMTLSMQALDSGIATIFVCFAEDRQILRWTQPRLYEKLTRTYNLY